MDATSKVSMELLEEIGRAVKTYDREQAKNNQKISEKPLAKSPVIDYTKVKGEFNTVKCESAVSTTKLIKGSTVEVYICGTLFLGENVDKSHIFP